MSTDLPDIYLDHLSTPCLVVEKQRLEANLQAMQAKATSEELALRPHAKTHKSIWIARQQLGLGGQGLAVATVAEAETFVAGGVEDVRIATEVVTEDAFARIQALRGEAKLSFLVDTTDGARAASAFFADKEPIDILIEVDSGHGRCGIPHDRPDQLEALANLVSELPGLRLVGLLTHAGHAYWGPGEGETEEEALRRKADEERDRLLAVANGLGEAKLLDPETAVLSLGSTPTMTYFEQREQEGFRITEVRPGNYVFFDAQQVALGSCELADCALTVWTTVKSKRRDGSRERLYLDAGRKILTSDEGYGTDGYGTILYNAAAMREQPHARITGLSEEHGWVEVSGGATFQVGDRVRVVPNHACTAVATQDVVFLVDGQKVVDVLTVDAR